MKRSDPIYKIAENINSLQRELAEVTLNAYRSEVDDIIRHGIQDKQRVEHILDRLLDAAFDEKVLEYFKKLCRHLYFFDEQAATFYVQSYREMWEDEEESK